MNLTRAWIQVALLTILCFICPTSFAQFLKPQDVNKLPAAHADHRIRYGTDPIQFSDLRLPKGKGPFPIAVVIHGGCWMKFAELITGTKDLLVPPRFGKEYETAAQVAGDKIEMIEIANAGHFEMIAPNSSAWPTVEWAVQHLVKLKR